MLSSSHKKVKTTDTTGSCSTLPGNGDQDFDKVKKYLLDCPLVASNHPAIQAAVAAIDKEQHRMERDRKLQQKFSSKETSAQQVVGVGGESAMSASSTLDDGVVVVERQSISSCSASSSPTPFSQPTTGIQPDNSNYSNNDMDEMEWQDVHDKDKEDWDDNPSSAIGSSFLGRNLAKVTIDSISEQNVKLQSPLAAIAVAFHASLRSERLDFRCTGVPEDPSALKGGFAPPVRELAKTQFLPPAWDVNPRRIALRYRKAGTGAMILTVELLGGGGGGSVVEGQTVTVRWQPATSKEEPSSQTLSFLLSDHVNLDSWNAALKTTSSVSPALHYKSLAVLLSNFCRTFDLGTIHEGMEEEPSTIPTGTSDTTTVQPTIQKSDFVPPISNKSPLLVPPVGMNHQPNLKYKIPTTLGEAVPGLNGPLRPQGDFAGDLLPSGLLDPRVPMGGDGRMSGNLMGPNHPLFRGGHNDDDHFGIPIGGPGSMQPRFDPIYPDVVDFPPGRTPNATTGRKSNRPSRSGEPNPDHLPPPNSFGHDMFS